MESMNLLQKQDLFMFLLGYAFRCEYFRSDNFSPKMLQNINTNPSDIIYVTYKLLPKATYVKLQPQSVAFLDISDPKAVYVKKKEVTEWGNPTANFSFFSLEKELRKHAALTEKSHILIRYNSKEYYFEVLELKPRGAVSIIEADVNFDFAPPIGYVEPPKKQPEKVSDKEKLLAEHLAKEVVSPFVSPSKFL